MDDRRSMLVCATRPIDRRLSIILPHRAEEEFYYLVVRTIKLFITLLRSKLINEIDSLETREWNIRTVHSTTRVRSKR